MNPANPSFRADALNHWPPRRKRSAPRSPATSAREGNAAATLAAPVPIRGVDVAAAVRRIARRLLRGIYRARRRQAQAEIARMRLMLGDEHPTLRAYRAFVRRSASS